VVLANFPVMLSALIAAYLGWQIGMSQVWLFYAVNGIGIPFFWFLVGKWSARRWAAHCKSS
jgi:hypothetical protein